MDDLNWNKNLMQTRLLSNPQLKQFLEGKTFLDVGVDSFVYKSQLEETVTKIYHPLRETKAKYTANDCCEIISKYYYDTLEAKKVMDKLKPTDKIIFNNEEYFLKVVILEQGNLKVVGDEAVGEGQQFIGGQNLLKTANVAYNSKGFEGFCLQSEFKQAVNATLRRTQDVLFESIQIPFSLIFLNVKAQMATESKMINLYVTDLSGSIRDDYLFHKIFKNYGLQNTAKY